MCRLFAFEGLSEDLQVMQRRGSGGAAAQVRKPPGCAGSPKRNSLKGPCKCRDEYKAWYDKGAFGDPPKEAAWGELCGHDRSFNDMPYQETKKCSCGRCLENRCKECEALDQPFSGTE